MTLVVLRRQDIKSLLKGETIDRIGGPNIRIVLSTGSMRMLKRKKRGLKASN